MDTRSAQLADIRRIRSLLADASERADRMVDPVAKEFRGKLAAIEAGLDQIVADLADDPPEFR